MVKWILLIVLIALVVWIIAAYNGLVKLKNKCEESFSTMDVYLKKRYDMIPNLVETVKAYAAHESKTLEGVIAARNMAMNASSTEDRIKGENMLQGTLRSLFAVSEAYPQLKADTGFADLRNQLAHLEDEIASSRKYYNAVVRQYNSKIEMFPSNLIASAFHFNRRSMFEVNDPSERENVPGAVLSPQT